MSKFLDHLDTFTGPRDTVLFREPMTAEVTWDVDTQRSVPFGKRYRISVNFGAQIVSKDQWETGIVTRQIRKLMAREIYGEIDEIKEELLQMQAKLYNTPDLEAQNMASDLNFILIKLDKATS